MVTALPLDGDEGSSRVRPAAGGRQQGDGDAVTPPSGGVHSSLGVDEEVLGGFL